MSAVDLGACTHTRKKAANWSKHETAKLCHVICSLIHTTVHDRLYVKPISIGELDRGRHDPWANEFSEVFKNDVSIPPAQEGHDGVTDDILASFQPHVNPRVRTGVTSKSLSNKLRSKYTIARQKYCRSWHESVIISSIFVTEILHYLYFYTLRIL